MNQDPDFPVALARLQSMTKDELHELFTDESKFDDYIKSLEQVRLFLLKLKKVENIKYDELIHFFNIWWTKNLLSGFEKMFTGLI